ncbi:hypothetical protein [Polaribacter butkevichii]|uniref:Uncharacterized protein n=1 Tax=Polaribacter butkevichii TaxID=218490 RepID=A0A2P6C7R0_9FLAO|nr:hypothetical protein [Polaribacter butkevichii]PQJ68983.1 hypothetical protein BTO14_13150 [Polaribacter butkevichii]
MNKNNSKKKDEIITFESHKIVKEIYNQNKSKLLILKYVEGKSPVITFNYQVIDVKTKRELKKGVFTGEKMEWLDESSLKCTPYIGIIEKENDVIIEENTPTKKRYITIKID